MKNKIRIVGAILAMLLAASSLSSNCLAAETAGLVGFVNTDKTVQNNGFTYPSAIWTVYTPNNPAEEATFLAYVAYKQLGSHVTSIEWSDKKGKPLDSCVFDAQQVGHVPFLTTSECSWGGRLPSGGLTVRVYNSINSGKKELISEMYLAEKMRK